MSTNNSVVYTVSLKDQLSSGLNHANTKAHALDNSMKGIGSTLAGLGIAYAGAQFLKDSVQQWSDSEKSLAQLNATLKSTGGAVGLSSDALQAQAKALQNITTYDDDAIIGMQSLLTTFTQIKGAVFTEAVPAIVDLSAKMGTDLKGSAIQVGKALNDPIRGISALQRVGVSFTESQKNLIKTLVETNDIAGAQKIILAELNTEFGGSAEAMGKAGLGPITMMQNKFHDVQEEIGGLVASVAIGLIPTIDKLVVSLGNAVKWIGRNKDGILTIAGALLALKGALLIVTPLVGLFGTTAAVALGPITATVAALTAMGAAYYYVSGAADRAKQAITDERNESSARLGGNTKSILEGGLALARKQGEGESEARKRISQSAIADLQKKLVNAESKAAEAKGWIDKFTAQRLENRTPIYRKELESSLTDIAQYQAQIKAAKEFGMMPKMGGKNSALENASKTDKTSKASTRSTSTGHQVTTINMSIKELIHEFNVNTTNVKEGAYKVGEMITNAITAALNDSQLIVK